MVRLNVSVANSRVDVQDDSRGYAEGEVAFDGHDTEVAGLDLGQATESALVVDLDVEFVPVPLEVFDAGSIRVKQRSKYNGGVLENVSDILEDAESVDVGYSSEVVDVM